MNDDNDNVVLKILEKIIAAHGELHVRFDGVETRLKDLEVQAWQAQATLGGVRDTGVKILSEVVSLSARLKAVEKRLEVIEAPKH